MKNVKKMSFLGRFAVGTRRYFIFAVVASALSIIFTFLTPQIISFTVDSIIGTEEMDVPAFVISLIDSFGGREQLRANLIFCVAAIGIFALLSGIFNYFSRTELSKGTEGFVKNLRDTLFTHIQHLPFSWHTDNQTGDIIQRCTSDVETIRGFVSAQLIEVVRTVLLITTALILMFSMNIKLTLVCLATIPIIVLYSTLFHGRISRQFRHADEAEGELMVSVQENLSGVRVVRAFGRERYEREQFEEKNNLFADKWIDLGYTLGFFWGIGDFASCAQLLAVISVGAWLGASGELSLGNLIAFITYTQIIAWPVRSLGRVISELSKAGVSVSRVRDILDTEVEAVSPDDVRPPLDEDIAFENVSFSYGDTEVLHDISFTVKKGTTFGILGSTGSGKSTLTYLINRLYELPEDGGRITIGGVDIREIDRYFLRRGVGLVLQEPFLYSKTVAENIGISDRSSDLKKIRQAAKIAAIDEEITQFSNSYDTIVGERGVTLSGGQKQRVAIARTLTIGSQIMIFDDSMSAVDMETDAAIRESLQKNTGSSTVILISHRINTLMRADKILVLHEGRVADIGTHSELVSRDGIYRRVYLLQSDAGLLNGGEANGF